MIGDCNAAAQVREEGCAAAWSCCSNLQHRRALICGAFNRFSVLNAATFGDLQSRLLHAAIAGIGIRSGKSLQPKRRSIL